MHTNYNYSQDILSAIIYARHTAIRLGSGEVTVDHLWLGVVRQHPRLAKKLKKRLRVDLTSLATEIERRCAVGAPGQVSEDLPYSEAGRTTLSRALSESESLGDTETRPEHLLMAILREESGPSVARETCANVGLSAERVALALRR